MGFLCGGVFEARFLEGDKGPREAEVRSRRQEDIDSFLIDRDVDFCPCSEVIAGEIAIEFEAPSGCGFLHAHPVVELLLARFGLPEFVLVAGCFALLYVLRDGLLDVGLLLFLSVAHTAEVELLVSN